MSLLYGESTTPPSAMDWQKILAECPNARANPYLNDGRVELADGLNRHGYHFEARSLLSGKLVPVIGKHYFPPHIPSFSIFDDTAPSRGVELTPVFPQPATEGWFPASIGIDPIAALNPRARWKRNHFVASLTKGACTASPWGYGIFAGDDTYATDFCCNDGPMIAWSGVVPICAEIPGTVAVFTQSWSNAVHHWNTETLPRFELLRLAGFTPDKIDFYVFRFIEPWHLEYTDRLGIPREKLLALGNVFNFRADRLLVCSNVENTDWTMNPPELEAEPWVNAVLASIIPDPNPDEVPTEKIYISRANAGSRRVMNEGEVRRFLEDNGFTTIFFENLNLEEKANLMRKTSVVVTPIGAALTYVPFMRPGSKCLGFYSDDGCGSTFRDLCANSGVIHIHAIFPSSSRIFPSQMVPVADHLREQIVDIKHLSDVMLAAGIPVPNIPDFATFRGR